MEWLVRDARPHDSLFFHCTCTFHCQLPGCNSHQIDSGHGGQTEDLDGDEEDGYDEGDDYMTLISQAAYANRLWDSHLPG